MRYQKKKNKRKFRQGRFLTFPVRLITFIQLLLKKVLFLGNRIEISLLDKAFSVKGQ